MCLFLVSFCTNTPFHECGYHIGKIINFDLVAMQMEFNTILNWTMLNYFGKFLEAKYLQIPKTIFKVVLGVLSTFKN
jgi:hypothetical protein